ncbi:MAG: hypothetical protein ACREQW_01290 [Candidatus Binatia bacterium]
MNALFWVLLVGGCGWLTGKIIGEKGYGETLGRNATHGLDIVLGVLGASIAGYLFSWAISGEGSLFNKYITMMLGSVAVVGVARQVSTKYLPSAVSD